MHLTCRVVGIESGMKFTDGRPRMTLRVDEADDLFREIRMPMPEFPKDLSLDQTLCFSLLVVDGDGALTEREPTEAEIAAALDFGKTAEQHLKHGGGGMSGVIWDGRDPRD